MKVETLMGLLKMLAKGALLLFGGLMLFGGGLCALASVGNIGKIGSGVITMLSISVGVALAGWVMLKAAKNINDDEGAETEFRGESARVGKLVLGLMAVWIIIQIGLSLLQLFLR
jgi:hypothetical protein